MQQIFVVCWVIVLLVSPLEGTDVRFITTNRFFDSKFISNFSVSIQKDPNSLNLDVTLTQPILTDFYAFIDVQIKLKDSTRYQSLFTEEFDVCELVNNVSIDNLMKKWYKNVLKYGNFMENCPVPEGHYFLRRLLVEQTSLAMYLRPGDYRIVGRWYFRRPGEKNETVVGGLLDVKWVK